MSNLFVSNLSPICLSPLRMGEGGDNPTNPRSELDNSQIYKNKITLIRALQ